MLKLDALKSLAGARPYLRSGVALLVYCLGRVPAVSLTGKDQIDGAYTIADKFIKQLKEDISTNGKNT